MGSPEAAVLQPAHTGPDGCLPAEASAAEATRPAAPEASLCQASHPAEAVLVPLKSTLQRDSEHQTRLSGEGAGARSCLHHCKPDAVRGLRLWEEDRLGSSTGSALSTPYLERASMSQPRAGCQPSWERPGSSLRAPRQVPARPWAHGKCASVSRQTQQRELVPVSDPERGLAMATEVFFFFFLPRKFFSES